MGKKTFQQLVWEPRCGSVWLSVLPGWGCDNIELSAGSSATPLSACSQVSESVGVAEGTQGPDSCPEPSSPVWGAGHIGNNSWTRGQALLFISGKTDPGLRWLLLGPCASYVAGHGQPLQLSLDAVTCGQSCHVAQLPERQIS